MLFVTLLTMSSNILIVTPAFPANNVRELIDADRLPLRH